jgi:hypothetical protein
MWRIERRRSSDLEVVSEIPFAPLEIECEAVTVTAR